MLGPFFLISTAYAQSNLSGLQVATLEFHCFATFAALAELGGLRSTGMAAPNMAAKTCM